MPFVGGSATFVDGAEATGYIGIAGADGVAPTHTDVASPVPAAGTLRSFRGAVGTIQTGNGIVLMLMKNNAVTTLTCTIVAPATSCLAPAGTTAAVAAGDTISVRITRSAGTAYVRNVRWAASFTTP